MNYKLGLVRFVCIALMSAASLSFGQSASDADKKFVKDALQGGNAEIELGKLAQKSKSDDVRQFGQKMVTDHTRMANHMRNVASQIGVDPPTGTSLSAKAEYGELKMLIGDSFDKAYLKAMMKDHQDDLNAFEQEASSGSSPAVKHAAEQGAKTVSSHLDLAKQIAANHQIDVQ
jgi:putative membrane protein